MVGATQIGRRVAANECHRYDAGPVWELERELVTDNYEILRHGRGGAVSNVICAAIRFNHPNAFDLVHLLPPVVHIEAAGSRQPDWITARSGSWPPRPGSRGPAGRR